MMRAKQTSFLPGLSLGDKAIIAGRMHTIRRVFYADPFDGVLFFGTNTAHEDSPYEWHYGFYYIDKNTLLIGGKSGIRDIKIIHLEKIESVHLQISEKQISLF